MPAHHPAIVSFARTHAQGTNDQEKAFSLYLAVRDQVRYDSYRIDLSDTGMTASTVLTQGFGWCVPKAVLLAAAARASGIAARLGFADVKNHLSTEKLRQTMQTDVFAWHGYAELWIDSAWRKATPAIRSQATFRRTRRARPAAAEQIQVVKRKTAVLAMRLGHRCTSCPSCRPKLFSMVSPLRRARTSKSACVPTRMLGVSYHW